MAGALSQGMMPTLTQTTASEPRAFRTRQEAGQLLKGLRAAYQQLSYEERAQTKAHVEKLATVQATVERN